MKKKSLFVFLVSKLIKNLKDNYSIYLLIISAIAVLGLSSSKGGINSYLQLVGIKSALILFIIILYLRIKNSKKIQRNLNSSYWQDNGARM